MATPWDFEDDVTPSKRDVVFMAEVLEGRHGLLAGEVAEFFSSFHGLRGDIGRSWAWAGVAEVVRVREADRMACQIY